MAREEAAGSSAMWGEVALRRVVGEGGGWLRDGSGWVAHYTLAAWTWVLWVASPGVGDGADTCRVDASMSQECSARTCSL